MKNKKIISRVLAIFVVLVLMVSMALPAFADEGVDSNLASWEQFYFTYSPNYGNLAFDEIYLSDFNNVLIQSVSDFYLFSVTPVDIPYYQIGGTLNTFYGNDVQYSGEYYIGEGYGEVVYTKDGSPAGFSFSQLAVYIASDLRLEFIFYDIEGNTLLTVLYDWVNGTGETRLEFDFAYDSRGEIEFDVLDVAFAIYDNSLQFSDDVVKTFSQDAYKRFSPSTFYDGMYLSNRPDGVVPPARTGLFGQLYYILYEAIYGADAVIGTTQDFILTQIATWLTFAVVLLPILVVAIFLWRVFVR